MESFNFQYDFSLLSAVELQKEKINFGEIISVFENNNTCAEILPDVEKAATYYFLTGFSNKSRFLYLILEYTADKIVFYEAVVADEQQIRTYYCGRY